MDASAKREGRCRRHRLADDGTFPNNEDLPLLVCRDAVALEGPDGDDPAAVFERVFARNGWGGAWHNGVYGYHHYHSTAHEVLGVARGTARVQFGGEAGPVVDLSPGDVVVIPAGVAHKNLGSSDDFLVVGAYPSDQNFDMNYGRPGERPEADRNLRRTPVPETDPVFGEDGPVVVEWPRHVA